MLLELFAELALLGTLVFCAYAGINAYLHRRQPHLAELLLKRRLAVLVVLMLLIVGFKIFEDVLGNESGVVDERVLRLVHSHVPAAFDAFFRAVTRSGSALVLVPLTAAVAIAFVFAKRRFEAGLILVSAGLASILMYTIKTITARDRPSLWETQWYWGSSFPSGHTLSTAAFSTATALCVARVWPRAGGWALSVALTWTFLVAFSRLVLGVHWPSDVVAAICLGMLIPLILSMGLDLYTHRVLPERRA